MDLALLGRHSLFIVSNSRWSFYPDSKSQPMMVSQERFGCKADEFLLVVTD